MERRERLGRRRGGEEMGMSIAADAPCMCFWPVSIQW